MRKVKLSMKEELYYETIKELIDHNGNKTRAALRLGISVRHVNRLIDKYKTKGKAGFIHGNKNRQPIDNATGQKTNRKDDSKDVLTQFGYACHTLGISDFLNDHYYLLIEDIRSRFNYNF